MKYYKEYLKRGRQMRIALFAKGETPEPMSVCPVGDATLISAFLQGWNSISGVRLEVEARLLNTRNTPNGSK